MPSVCTATAPSRTKGHTADGKRASIGRVTPTTDPVADDSPLLRAALAAERLARREAEARASGAEAMVARFKLLIAQLKHDRFGASSERGRKLLDQLELQLEELEATAAEDAAALGPDQEGLLPRPRAIRREPVRGPLPAHRPRERVVIPGKRFAFRRARPPVRGAGASSPSSARMSRKRWRWCPGGGR